LFAWLLGCLLGRLVAGLPWWLVWLLNVGIYRSIRSISLQRARIAASIVLRHVVLVLPQSDQCSVVRDSSVFIFRPVFCSSLHGSQVHQRGCGGRQELILAIFPDVLNTVLKDAVNRLSRSSLQMMCRLFSTRAIWSCLKQICDNIHFRHTCGHLQGSDFATHESDLPRRQV
jgi:hypothetical protein